MQNSKCISTSAARTLALQVIGQGGSGLESLKSHSCYRGTVVIIRNVCVCVDSEGSRHLVYWSRHLLTAHLSPISPSLQDIALQYHCWRRTQHTPSRIIYRLPFIHFLCYTTGNYSPNIFSLLGQYGLQLFITNSITSLIETIHSPCC